MFDLKVVFVFLLSPLKRCIGWLLQYATNKQLKMGVLTSFLTFWFNLFKQF